MKKMVNKKSWKDFRETGLLFYINQILHVFGWAIVVNIENGEITEAYPARVKFRGFDGKSIDEGYAKVTKYLKNNVDDLLSECEEMEEEE